MKRRNFIGACAALASIPAIGRASELATDWRMMIGGCRCGKTTYGLKQFDESRCGRLFVLHGDGFLSSFASFCKRHGIRNAFTYARNGQLCSLEELRGSQSNLTNAMISRDTSNDFLLIDEYCCDHDIVSLARKFKSVVWCNRPSPEVQDHPFFKACKAMGTVKYMPASTLVNVLFIPNAAYYGVAL